MPDNNISKAQPSKAKGLGGVFPLRSKNAALLYMYRYRNCDVPNVAYAMNASKLWFFSLLQAEINNRKYLVQREQ